MHFFSFFLLVIFNSPHLIKTESSLSEKPHIIFIVADDLGWNDIGFHGSNQIPTPNIDALAFSGVILNNYYVAPICTPSRSALMTGKYPIHTGMQHTVLFGAEARGLPLSEKLLPEYLKEAGYSTHAVGKWHLGSWKAEYTPTFRGFESHLGYWTGHQDYNDHTAMETGMWGLDMRRNLDVASDLHGRHSTEVFTHEAFRIIEEHDPSNPLFLYLAHVAVHSGNPYNPICTIDKEAAAFNITDYYRRRFAGVLKGLDDSVGEVVEALRMKGILHNSIIVFTTDNGGPAAGFNLNAASNWPLRGVKNTLWEGGVRGAGLIWSPILTNMSIVSDQMTHISDWLPTLLSAASIEQSFPTPIDGIDQWPSLKGEYKSGRTEVLHNIDDQYGNAALTVGDWKIVKGTTYKGQWDGWYGPSGRDNELRYDPSLVVDSLAGKAVVSVGQVLTEHSIRVARKHSELVCWSDEKKPCDPLKSPCLFNIKQDPCEYINLAESYPRVLRHLDERLEQLNKTALPPGNLPVDPKGNPKNWNNVWTNFGDFDLEPMAVISLQS